MSIKIASVISLLFISAYAGAQTSDDSMPAFPEKDKVILNVKFMKQGNMGCSRTSFAMVMHYHDPSITLERVERDAPRAPDGGSQNNFMTVLAEHYGFNTHAFPGKIDRLIALLKSGQPVIVAQYPDLSEKKSNHDRVVVGFDRGKRTLFVHDPSVGENIPYPYEKFMSLWEAEVGLDERYFSVLVTKEHAAAEETGSMNIDGMDRDWAGRKSFSPDRADDTDKGDLHLNIRDVYCFKDDSFLYLKTNFVKSPGADTGIIYFFNLFYIQKGSSAVRQLNFRQSHSPWIQIDAKRYESMTNVEWKIGDVYEAKVGLGNFKDIPDIVSIQAGVYDTKRKKFIDLSYPNAFRIR